MMDSVNTVVLPAHSAVVRDERDRTLTCRLHSSCERRAMFAVWRDVERRITAVPLLCSADWTETWLDHYGILVPHRFAVVRHADDPIAVALITQGSFDSNGLVPIHARCVGTTGEPDAHSVCVEYNALMCEPAHRAVAWMTLLEELERDAGWDELRLDGFAAADLGEMLNVQSDWHWVSKPSRYIDLDAVRQSGRELITFVGDSTRRSIRRSLQHYGNVTIEWSMTADHADDIFEDLIRLHQQRWQAAGKPGCYSSPIFTAFHRDAIRLLVPQGRMALFRVRAGGVTLTCTHLLIDRDRVLHYQGGRLTSDQKHSPGLMNDYLATQAALERGYSAFDFMAGESSHKQRLTTHAAELVWGVRRRPRLKFAVMDQLRQIKRWLKSLQESDRSE